MSDPLNVDQAFKCIDTSNRDPVHFGFKGTCPSCPFNAGMNEEAEIAASYGCLPGPGEILQMKRETGNNWACHSDPNKVCTGLCLHAKENSLDMSKGTLIHEEGVHPIHKLKEDITQ